MSNKRILTRSLILRTIHQSNDGTTMAHLSHRTGLNTVSVKHHVDRLIREGKIVKTGKSQSRGRPVHVLRANPKSGYLVGLDMDPSGVTAVVSDMGRQIKASLEKPIDRMWPANRIVATLVEAIKSIIEQASIPRDRIEGVGIALTGFYNRNSGVAITSSSLPNWRNVPIKFMLEEALGLPIIIEHSYTAATLAEMWFGKGNGISSFVVMRIRTGVTMGMVFNGEVYTGQGNAGTINNVYAEPRRIQLAEGQPRTLFELASGHAILDKLRPSVSSQNSPILWERIGGRVDNITLEDVCAAAAADDALCLSILTEAATCWGRVFALWSELLHPQKAILTGSFNSLRHLLTEPMRQGYREALTMPLEADLLPEFSDLDKMQGALGAAAMVLRHSLQSLSQTEA